MAEHRKNSFNFQPIVPCLALAIAYTTSVYFFLYSPFWWDEGWNFLSAHTHIVTGYYGKMRMGEFVPGTLANGRLVVALVEIGFKLLGLSPFCGRAVNLLLCLCSITCLYHLGKYLYNSTIASLAVIIAALLYAGETNPIFFATHAVGEGPMICFATAGLLALTQVRKWPILAPTLTSLFWALALSSKPQLLPFLYCSMAAGLIAALALRQKQYALTLTLCFLGTQIFKWILTLILGTIYISPEATSAATDIFTVQAFVPFNWEARNRALQNLYLAGLPAIATALRYTGLWIFGAKEQLNGNDPTKPIVNVMLATLFASWLAWYSFFSIGWPRYLGPVLFFASIHCAEFAAFLVSTLVSGISKLPLRKYRQALTMIVLPAPFLWLFFQSFKISILTLWLHQALDRNAEYHALVNQLNSLPAETVIETYESELLYQLKPLYHYPPDDLHVRLNQQTFLGEKLDIDYDPSAQKPDYLIIGKYGMLWKLYHSFLESNRSGELVQEGGRYVVIRFNHNGKAKNPSTSSTTSSDRSRTKP